MRGLGLARRKAGPAVMRPALSRPFSGTAVARLDFGHVVGTSLLPWALDGGSVSFGGGGPATEISCSALHVYELPRGRRKRSLLDARFLSPS